MKLYIAGKITDKENYKKDFDELESILKARGHVVINPACLPLGFTHWEYMKVCLKMVEICEGIVLLPDWIESKGAKQELVYAINNNKKIFTKDDFTY
jgi:hypothetical protein